MKRLAGLTVLLLPLSAAAQVSGPAVQACTAYAEREIKSGNESVKSQSGTDDQTGIDRGTKGLAIAGT